MLLSLDLGVPGNRHRRDEIDRQREHDGRGPDQEQQPIVATRLREDEGLHVGSGGLKQREANGRHAPRRLLLGGVMRQ